MCCKSLCKYFSCSQETVCLEKRIFYNRNLVSRRVGIYIYIYIKRRDCENGWRRSNDCERKKLIQTFDENRLIDGKDIALTIQNRYPFDNFRECTTITIFMYIGSLRKDFLKFALKNVLR